ncbi:hypothetical protein [Teichococcus aestuarii]|uniref:hypothetical protein n=1 Tax=Teichococcus aestuarii TaxID=568898 RepID=UPI003618782F
MTQDNPTPPPVPDEEVIAFAGHVFGCARAGRRRRWADSCARACRPTCGTTRAIRC